MMRALAASFLFTCCLSQPALADDGPCFLRGKNSIERILLERNATVYRNTPKWEGVEKNEALTRADADFVEEFRKATKGDLKAGARGVVKGAWEWFATGDFETTLRRFNQAWLLDPENPAIYWGFALVTHVRGDGLEVSECWFDEAEKREMEAATRAALYADRGKVLEEKNEPDRARSYFEKALATDAGNAQAKEGFARLQKSAP